MQFRTIPIAYVTGKPAVGAEVEVFIANTETLQEVYDENGTALVQPLVSNVFGEVAFAAPNGSYDLNFSVKGASRKIENLQFSDFDRYFATRAALVSSGYAPDDGTVVTADGLSYLRKSGETVLPGLAGWLPIDATPKHFGAVGNGVVDDTAAVQNAVGSGLPLNWGNLIYRITSSIDETLTTPVDWISNNAVILFDADTDQDFAARLETDFDVTIEGLLTFNLDDKAALGLFIRSGDATGEGFVRLKDTGASRPRLSNVTQPTSGAIRIEGRYKGVIVEGAFWDVITMAKDAGTAGSRGCHGVAVRVNDTEAGGENESLVIIRDTRGGGVISDDATYTNDQDSVLVRVDRQNDANNARQAHVLIENTWSKNACGRAVKVQAENATVVNTTIIRDFDVVPIGIGPQDIDLQVGAGRVDGVYIDYRNHVPGAVVFTNTTDEPKDLPAAIIQNIQGTVDSSLLLEQVVGQSSRVTDLGGISFNLSGINVRGPVLRVLDVRPLNEVENHVFALTDVFAEPTQRLVNVRSATAPFGGEIILHNCHNIGATQVPAVNAAGSFVLDASQCSGFSGTRRTSNFGAVYLSEPVPQIEPVGVTVTDVIVLLEDASETNFTMQGRFTFERGTATSFGALTVDLALVRRAGDFDYQGYVVTHGLDTAVSLISCTYDGVSRVGVHMVATGGIRSPRLGDFTGAYSGALPFGIVPASGVTSIAALPIRADYLSRSSFSQPLTLTPYTVATLPSAASFARAQVWVSDEIGGAQPAYSDSTNWRRYSDGAIVS